MKMISLRILLLTLCVMANAASAEEWGCYDPKPGHPTLDEKKAFVAELAPTAQAAERQFGVPAPAILAMASLESGFGFTRTALNANNLFGWKYYSAASAGNRQAWVLECQPKEDQNNRYIKFSSRDEAVNFVALKLATLDRYRPITSRYRAQRSQRDGVLEAINAWVDGVADAGYNWKPDEYKSILKAILTNYLNPGIESRDFNLYQYAANPLPASGQHASVENHTDLLELVKSGFGLYMAQDCRSTQYPGWEKFPVQDCRYTVKDRKTGLVKSARVLLLNPTPEKAAAWIRSACKASSSPKDCHKKVVAQIKQQSGFQFPVAGVVYEDILPCDGVNEAFCFRNGVTVKVAGFKHRDTEPLSAQSINTCINGEVTEVLTFARIHGGTREDYLSTGGTEEVGTSEEGERKAKWMDVVREAYQAAWEGQSYSLLNSWVKNPRER